MARYRALAEIHLGPHWPHVQAGDTLFDGPGGNIPEDFKPPGCVEPLNKEAVQAFWNAGVQFPGQLGTGVAPPRTKWVPDPSAPAGNPYRQFCLSGLGEGLPHRQA